jgi:hypothetical protein
MQRLDGISPKTLADVLKDLKEGKPDPPGIIFGDTATG